MVNSRMLDEIEDPPDREPYGPAIGTGITEHRGELRLVLTLLSDALETATQNRRILDRSDQRVADTARQEAIDWIFSDDRSWPFAFLPVCELLGIDPVAIRTHIAYALRHRRRALWAAFPKRSYAFARHQLRPRL